MCFKHFPYITPLLGVCTVRNILKWAKELIVLYTGGLALPGILSGLSKPVEVQVCFWLVCFAAPERKKFPCRGMVMIQMFLVNSDGIFCSFHVSGCDFIW